MEITWRRFEPVVHSHPVNGFVLNRFRCLFAVHGIEAQATVCHIGSERPLDFESMSRLCIGTFRHVSCTSTAIADFASQSQTLLESFVPLGAPGEFFMRGRLTRHLELGEGSIMSAAGVDLPVLVTDVPEYALELSLNSYVSCRVIGLCLWLDEQPAWRLLKLQELARSLPPLEPWL